MALDNYDPLTSRSAYVPSGAVNASRLAAHWTVDKYVHDMAAIGIISFFEGEANDPTTLSGYSSSKLWLRTPAGVTDEAGSVLIWDTVNSESLASSWVPLTPQRFSELIAETYILGGPLGSMTIGAFAATRTILKALDTTVKKAAYLSEAGREGLFVWRTGNYAARVTADATEGRFLKADAIATTAGAWERVDDKLNVRHFGAIGDGTTSDRAAIQAALDTSAAMGGMRVYIPASANPYLLLATDGVLQITADILLYGDGPDMSVLFKQDYTGSTGSGRRDCIRSLVTDSNVEFRDFEIRGEFETVDYRYGGDQQFEGYAVTSGSASSTVIILPASASAVDDYYNGANIQIAAGVGAGTDQTVLDYDGATRAITLDAATLGGVTPNSTSLIQIGAAVTGMGAIIQDSATVSIHNVKFRGCRNQALNITNVADVSVTNCNLYKVARGGISVRRSKKCNIANNRIEFTGDDAIFNSQASAGDGQSLDTTVVGNTLIDTCGMRFLGARRLNITGNTLTRSLLKGIAVGGISTTRNQNQVSVTIADNNIHDVLDRGSIFYANPSSVRPAAIEISNGTGSETFRIIGQMDGGNIVKPEDSTLSVTTLVPFYGVTVTGNNVTGELKVGRAFSEHNGVGIFYHRGTGFTGFVDRVATADDIDCYAMQVSGPFHNLFVGKNNLSARITVPAIAIEGGNSSGLDSDIQYDYALTNVVFDGNKITRCKSALYIEQNGSDKVYDMRFCNNDVDCDPYHEAALRTSPLDGTWTGASQWAVDNLRTFGMTITGNRFANTPSVLRNTRNMVVLNNIVFARATAVGDNAANQGVRDIPYSGVEFIVVDRDSNPNSASYLDNDGQTLLERHIMPSSGRYVAGHVVRNVATATTAIDGSHIIGWKRLTTGAGHTLGTNWAALRGFADYEEAEGEITFASLVFAGTGPVSDAGDTLDYFWSRLGKRVTVQVRLFFNDAGSAAYTECRVPFSACGSLPAPREHAGVGVGAAQHLWPGAGVLATSVSANPNTSRTWIHKDSSNAYHMNIIAASGAYAFVAFNFEYLAA